MKSIKNKKALITCYCLIIYVFLSDTPFFRWLQDIFESLFGYNFHRSTIVPLSFVALLYVFYYHFESIKSFFKKITSTELPKNFDHTTDINSAQLRIIFKEYSKSFLKLLITVAIGVLNAIGGVLILLSRDRDFIQGYTIFSICISVFVFCVSVIALYKLYIISDNASK